MHSTKKVAKPMNETEAKAKKIALAYERKRIEVLMGKKAVSMIKEVGEGGGYEIVSPDGRTIEVKGAKGKKPNYAFVVNSKHEVKHLAKGGYIYRITDVYGPSPTIHILCEEHLVITPRYRADVKIRKGAKYEMVKHITGEAKKVSQS